MTGISIFVIISLWDIYSMGNWSKRNKINDTLSHSEELLCLCGLGLLKKNTEGSLAWVQFFYFYIVFLKILFKRLFNKKKLENFLALWLFEGNDSENTCLYPLLSWNKVFTGDEFQLLNLIMGPWGRRIIFF